MSFMAVFDRKFTVDGIDAKVIADTIIWTNNGTTDFVLSGGAIRCTSASGITIGPTIGLGTSAGTNDILISVGILALTAAKKVFNFSLIGMSVIIPPGGNIYCSLSIAATGTSQVISIDSVGYWT